MKNNMLSDEYIINHFFLDENNNVAQSDYCTICVNNSELRYIRDLLISLKKEEN